MAGMIYDKYIAGVEEDAATVEKVEATAKDKLVVTFNQRLLEGNNIRPAAFDVKVDGSSVTIKSLSVSRNGDGNTVVTLNLDGEMEADASNVVLDILGNDAYLKNVFEVPAEQDLGITVDDKIAPSYDKDSITVADNEVTITFDENIKGATVSLYTFEVRNNDIIAFSVGEEDDTVVLTLKDPYESGAKVRVSQKHDIEDTSGNKYRNTDTIEVKAGAATPTPNVVDALDLTGLVTAPVIGGNSDTKTIDEAQYTGTIVWYESDGITAVDGDFAAETVYVAVVTLVAADGYTFDGVVANSFTYTEATTVENDADSGVVTITFPATDAE
jgi:hypothetical protein